MQENPLRRLAAGMPRRTPTGRWPVPPGETPTGAARDTGAAPPVAYVCPCCKGTLVVEPTAYTCPVCDAVFPIVLGIPDFRVASDAAGGDGGDRALAEHLAAGADGAGFADLIERYWALMPGTPPDLARRYVRHALGGVERARSSLAEIEWQAGGALPDGPFLEVGCGTGGFLVAAAERFGPERILGIDPALAPLVLARARLAESGSAAGVRLALAHGEALPFPDGTFGLVVAADVVEHTATQEALVRRALRSLRPGGVFFFATPNRLSLTPEPHVRVWGVGFLPRRLMPAWVRLVRRVGYDDIRILSVFEIRRLLRRAGAERYRVVLPRIDAAELARYGRWERRGVTLYHALLAVPPARWALSVCGPFFHVLVWRPADELAQRASEPERTVDRVPDPRAKALAQEPRRSA